MSANTGTVIARRSLIFALPALLFAAIAGVFLWGLQPGRDPQRLPSVLIDQPVPQFDLPPIQGYDGRGLSSALLQEPGIKLVNVFASWCVPCKVEHPLLMELAAEGQVSIYGINYKDKPEDARRWLSELGDPFTAIGADESGRASIDWGVYGVPETFVIDGAGRIRYRHVGPLYPDTLDKLLRPLVAELKRSSP